MAVESRAAWRARLALVVVFTLIVAACTSAQPSQTSQVSGSAQPSQTSQVSGAPIVLGLDCALSAPGDVPSGIHIVRGAELGLTYVNDVMGGVLGGRKLQIVETDDSSLPANGINNYRRLVSQDHAVVVFGFQHSAVQEAVNAVANDLKVPVIGTYDSADAVTGSAFPYSYRTNLLNSQMVDGWIAWAKQQGYHKIAVLVENSDFGLSVTQDIAAANTSLGLNASIDTEKFDTTATDFTPQLLKIKAFAPDVLFNVSLGQQIDLTVDQAATLGLTPGIPTLLSVDQPTNGTWWKSHPNDGLLYFTMQYKPGQALSTAGQWFYQQFQQKYPGTYPTFPDFSGFGDVYLIAQAIDKAGAADPASIQNVLNTDSFVGWTGTVTFPDAAGAAYHTWSAPVLIAEYTEPNQTVLDAKISLAYTPTVEAGAGASPAPTAAAPTAVGASQAP